MKLFKKGQNFDASKMKSRLKMAQTRINLLKNKTINSVKIQKRQTAALLREGKDESARIKAENIVREDYLLDALDILHLFCELLLTRIHLIEESKEPPHDMKEAISTLIYAAPRVDVEELRDIREMFASKYGKAFVQSAMENRELVVNQRVVLKLDLKVPKPHLCISYIKKIAEENGIEWDDVEDPSIAQDQIDNPELGYPTRNDAPGYNVDFRPNINPYDSGISQDAIFNPNNHVVRGGNSDFPYGPNSTTEYQRFPVPPNPPQRNDTFAQDDDIHNFFQTPITPTNPPNEVRKQPQPRRQEVFSNIFDEEGTNIQNYNVPTTLPSDDEDDELQRRLRELSNPSHRVDLSSNNTPNNDDDSDDGANHDFLELQRRFEQLNKR